MSTDKFMSDLETAIDNYLCETYSDSLASSVARSFRGDGLLSILVWHMSYPSKYALFKFHETNDKILVELSYRDICDGIVAEIAERIDSGEMNFE